VLDALETDHDYLLEAASSPPTSSRRGLEYQKRLNEVDAVRLRPHPYEFALYYDI